MVYMEFFLPLHEYQNLNIHPQTEISFTDYVCLFVSWLIAELEVFLVVESERKKKKKKRSALNPDFILGSL